jgi:cytochrome P450
MDYNEKVFQSPESFLPDRWLVDDLVALKRLENAWAPFSKGSRGCIGINLALAEVYITLASLVRRFKLKSRDEGEIKIREVFGVIFLSPIFVRLASMTE